MGGYIRTVSGQRLSKHVPAASDMNATLEELCFLCGPCRDVISKGQGWSLVLYGSLLCKDLSRRQRNSHCWSRYQESSTYRLRTLECVL
jgi:hypothetical protein